MPRSRVWSVSLGFAGVLTCGMGLYHFVLPTHMGWRQWLGGVPDTIVWALFALNFSWSLLVFLAGSLVIHAARLGPGAGAFARRTVFVVGLFWGIHGAYTWISPLPLPASLLWLRIVLGLFPAVMVMLHWLPLMVQRVGPEQGVQAKVEATRPS